MGEDAVDGGVVMRGVVVEQRQALGPRLLGDGDRVLGRAVAPRRLRRELLGGVLRIVDQQVDAVAQREHLVADLVGEVGGRSGEHTSELQSLMRISYAVFCLKKKNIDKY